MNTNTTVQKITGKAKEVAGSAVIAYIAVVAVNGLSKLAKDFWDFKIQKNGSKN